MAMISGGNPEVANRESSRSYWSPTESTAAVVDLDMTDPVWESTKTPTPTEHSGCHAWSAGSGRFTAFFEEKGRKADASRDRRCRSADIRALGLRVGAESCSTL